jgi:nucleoid-associated protein YgaU
MCAALAFAGGCKSLGLNPPETVTSEKVLPNLEAQPKNGQQSPEIVQLPAPPQPSYAPAPPPAPAMQPAVASRPAEDSTFEDDTTVRAGMKHSPKSRTGHSSSGRSVAAADQPAGGGKTHVVQRGETLQKISQKYYGTTTKWTKIFEANRAKIKRPDLIVVGTKLVIP